MSRRLAIKDQVRERHTFAARSAGLFAIVVGLVGLLVVRMIQLQVWEHETYQTRSEQNRIQVQPLSPPRGLIYDRNGELLAGNQAISTLTVVRERVPDMDALLEELAVPWWGSPRRTSASFLRSAASARAGHSNRWP